MDDDDDEGCGEVISPRIGLGLGFVEGKSRTCLRELRSESGHPKRRAQSPPHPARVQQSGVIARTTQGEQRNM